MHIGITGTSIIWFYRIFDMFIPIIILYLATSAYSLEWAGRYALVGMLCSLIFVFFSQETGSYDKEQARSYYLSSKMVIKPWILTWTGLIIVSFLYKDSQYLSRVVLVFWAVATPVTLILLRMLLRKLVIKYGHYTGADRRIAIAGAGNIAQRLVTTIQSNKWLGYNVTAVYANDDTALMGLPVLGRYEKIIEGAHENLFDELYICIPLSEEETINKILNEVSDSTLIVKFIPDLFSFDLMHAKWTNLEGIPVLSVYDTPLNSFLSQKVKRVEDLFLSSIILILISPLLVALAIGVKLTSRGPVFYKQTRVGWNGKNFKMLKFRSMPMNNESDEIQWGNAKNKINTKFGQFIRKYSLDELPQFFNVIKGDMSIVGPRPERDVFVEQFRKEVPRYMQKHMVKAGITGWAQVNGWRGDTCLKERIQHDLHYIKSWSLWLDIKIIIQTVFRVFIDKNAN